MTPNHLELKSADGTKLGVQLFHPEYDVDAINSLFMQKKFDEMRQRLHHDFLFGGLQYL